MDVCWVSGIEAGLNKHALVKGYQVVKPAIQLQKQTSACSYLRFLHLNDPSGRHNDSSVSPQGTWFFNVMQHETGDFIMKLEVKKTVESIMRPRKTKGKHGEDGGSDGTKTGAMFSTPLSSSPSNSGVYN